MACTLGLVLLSTHLGSSEDQAGDRHQPRADTDPVIIDADRHGALVLARGTVRGVTRKGRTLWTEPAEALPLSIVCTGACPSAVLSGDGRRPLATDPRPLLRGDADIPRAWAAPTAGKNEILASGPRGAVRLVTDHEARPYWELSGPDRKIRRHDAPGTNALWFPTRDRTAAVALLTGPGGSSYVQALVTTDRGWRLLGHATRSRDGAGCISPQGSRRMLDGLTIQTQTGSIPLRGVVGTFGNCTFTPRHLVLVSHSRDAGGDHTELISVDQRGQQVWRHSIDRSQFVEASTREDRFVTSGDGSRLAVERTGRGRALRRLPGVSFATYDDQGTLVVVDPTGRVRWLD